MFASCFSRALGVGSIGLTTVASWDQASQPLPWKDATPTPAAVAAVPTLADAVMPPIMLNVAGMDRLQIWRNLDYAKSSDPFVRMENYGSRGPLSRCRPAILLIHGGVSTQGQAKDRGIYQSWGRLMAASGFVGVTFTHRLGFPKTQVPEGAADVAAATQFTGDHATAYGVDPSRLCRVAFSAGGPRRCFK
jgi:acetyl esterase/lipase